MVIPARTHIEETSTRAAAATVRLRSRANASKKRLAARTPRWTKAGPISFKRSSTLDDTMAAVIGSCLHHWTTNLPAAIDGRNPEGVHQVRVGLRRFRSALSLFKSVLPDAQRALLNAEAKWLADQLSPLRDLDVFLGDLEKRHVPEEPSGAALERALKAAHARARVTATAAMRGPRMRRFSARVEAWVEGRGWLIETDDLPDVRHFARHALNKRLRKIQAAAARAEELSVPERHELRIAVKKLRYGLEFLHPALPQKRTARMGALLKRLQDSLGHLNDLDVAERTITQISTRASAADRKLIKRGAESLAEDLRKAVAKAEPETERLCHKLVKLPAF